MKTKRDQHKVGIGTKPRGQQTGMAGKPDQNREAMKKTPPVLGRRKRSNKMAADKSAQNIGGDAVTGRTTSPSTPAMNTGRRKGESHGETLFKKRLTKSRATSSVKISGAGND
jgi:hypothetical protein